MRQRMWRRSTRYGRSDIRLLALLVGIFDHALGNRSGGWMDYRAQCHRQLQTAPSGAGIAISEDRPHTAAETPTA